ncbi:MAG: hypothetical protein KAS32_24430, partial [Candidatus Peribacteraceae bacterium]|nr:hypothetical protein [Candidatus Peribacteraceae bacterium]
MPELIIENINNLDKQSDPTQIPLTTGVEVKDLSTTKKPGSLVKAGNYEDDPTAFIGTPTIPAGLLIRSMSEMPITRPESKDIYIIHAQDAAIEDHLYVGPFYDGTTFQNGLLKVTDKITSRITITASDTATTTTITIDSSNPNFSLFSQTDDEYNGWFMDYTVNTGEAAGFKILDYAATAASVVLTVSNVIPGTPGTNDFFNLGKYPILGTNLTGPDIGGITPIDNGIRFVNRENLVIGMTGNQFPYPDQYQLWYGFINRSFGNEVVVANLIAPEEFSDFWCDTQQMMKPFVTDPAAPPNLRGIVESVTQGAGNLTAGEWEVAFAYEYDGFQIGPLSDPILSTTAANKDLTLIFQIPYNSNNNTSLSAGEHSAFDPDDVPNNYNPILLSRRITGLFIFAKEPATETFRLVTATVATEANPSPISGFQPTPGNAGFSLTDDGLLQDAFAFSENPIGVIYETFVGQTGVRTNFKFGLSVDDHFIVAAIINEEGEPLENHLIASTIQSNAVAAVDNFGGSNEINLGFYGSKNITGLILIEAAAQTTSPKRRMVVFTDDDLYVLQITSGAVF